MRSSPAPSFCVRPRGLAQHAPTFLHFYQSNMTRCHNVLHRKLQDATDVQSHKGLGEQPGFVQIFRSHEGGPVGRSTCRPSKPMFAGSTIGGKITSLWYPIQQLAVRGKSSEPAPSSAIFRVCISEPRGSRWSSGWIGATHVFFPHVSIGRPHPPVRTSSTLLHDAPEGHSSNRS